MFRNARELHLPVGHYAIFGSGPICIRGLRECRDIDIIVTAELFRKLRSDPRWEVKALQDGSEYLSRGAIELYNDWGPGEWDIEKLIREAEVIDGLSFVRLEEVCNWKKTLGREKDLKDLELIASYLD